jgi:hypothetical protein
MPGDVGENRERQEGRVGVSGAGGKIRAVHPRCPLPWPNASPGMPQPACSERRAIHERGIMTPPHESRFVLHRFNGDEIYRFESADMYVLGTAAAPELWFEVEAARKGAQRCADTAGFRAAPQASVGIVLPDLDADRLVGREFLIPGASSYDEDSSMSMFCYQEHEQLRENRITVVSRAGDRFRLRWTAITREVHPGYDDSTPLTHVEIEGDFLFQDLDEWAARSLQ